MVLLADGRLVPIASVRVGDLVQATDPETGESGPRPVSKLIMHGGDHVMVDVVLADGSVIAATDHHPFWSVDRDEFVDAVDLVVGERLLSASGETLTIADLRVSNYEVMAYNLTVEDIHTYYAGNTPILVHNSCGDGEQLQLFDDTPYITGGAATNNVSSILDSLPRGKQPNVRTVDSDAALQALFDSFSAGGTPVSRPSYDGHWYQLDDGCQVGIRNHSDSGGRTIDVRSPDGRIWKVHIV